MAWGSGGAVERSVGYEVIHSNKPETGEPPQASPPLGGACGVQGGVKAGRKRRHEQEKTAATANGLLPMRVEGRWY